jgi:hypothetical protein
MAKKIIDFITRLLNFIKSITIVPAVKLILFIIKLLKKSALFIFARLKKLKRYVYYKNKKSAAIREASHGFNLYKFDKFGKAAPGIAKAVNIELKKQAVLNKIQEKEREKNTEKKRVYKSSGKKMQSLGSLKSLSSIKFK